MKKMNRVYRDMLIPFVFAVLALVLPAFLIKFGIIDAYTAQIITLGGVNAIKVWFLQDRIETSFIGRIKSFCNFFFTKF